MLAQADLRRQLRRVNDIELRVLPRQIPLHLGGEVLLQLLRRPRAVQQERAAVLQILGQVVLLNICRRVAGHKVGGGHQIGAADGHVAEAQMALGQAAGFHGVVGEIRLGVLVSHQADGGNGVLVGAHGAVAAQTPDLAGNLAGMGELHVLIGQRGVGHIVVDADGKVVFRRLLPQVVVYGDQLAGSGVLAGQTVAAAHHADVAASGLIQRRDHVQIHWLTHGARLLAAIQHGDALAAGGDGGGEIGHGEGAVQMDLHHAHLASAGVEVVHRLPQRLGDGAHSHHNLLGVGRAVVIEQLVVPAGDFIDLVHVVLHGTGHDGTLDVSALLALEVHVGVHVVAAVGGMLRIQRIPAEGLQRLVVDQTPQLLIVQRLDALHLVGGAEAVKAVHEGVLRFDGGQVRHRRQIHGLLRGGGHQHGVAGGATGHKVRMVAENGVMVAGDHAGCDVHHAGEELSAHGVHSRDHQHQSLRGRERGGQGARLQGAVAGTGSAGLGLHLDHVHRRAEQVLFPLGGPLVHLFRHRGGRRDGINGRHLSKGVGRMGCRCIAVHDDIILLTHIPLNFQCSPWKAAMSAFAIFIKIAVSQE